MVWVRWVTTEIPFGHTQSGFTLNTQQSCHAMHTVLQLWCQSVLFILCDNLNKGQIVEQGWLKNKQKERQVYLLERWRGEIITALALEIAGELRMVYVENLEMFGTW